MLHIVEPPYLRPSQKRVRNLALGLSSPIPLTSSCILSAMIINVNVAVVSPARDSWRDVAFALAIVEQVKRDKHTKTCHTHRVDSCLLGSLSSNHLAPRRKISLTMCAVDIMFTHKLLSGRATLGSNEDFLLLSCGGG